jgi:hypothetical protein
MARLKFASLGAKAAAAGYRERIARMYAHYEPARVAAEPGLVDGILAKYAGKEAAVLEALVQKHGPEPPTDASPVDQ